MRRVSHTRLRFLRQRSRPQLGQRSKVCLSHNSEIVEANLMILHRKIKHNRKVCRAQDLGFYAQVHGHNRVGGQISASAITQKLPKQI